MEYFKVIKYLEVTNSFAVLDYYRVTESPKVLEYFFSEYIPYLQK